MNPSELQHQRAIFERASIGVVEAGLEGVVQYANRHAMELLGVSTYEGLLLSSFYADKALLEEQVKSRKAGLIGNYRTTMVRQSDDEHIPVQVTAIPLTDRSGKVVGSFALFRLPMEEEINRLHQEVDDADSLLFRVMQELNKVVPYDMVTATRFSDDLRHAQPFFIFRPKAARSRVEWHKQWQAIPEELLAQVAQTETQLFDDLGARLNDPNLGQLRQSPLVNYLINEGLQSCIRRPIRRKGRTWASVTFYSKRSGILTEEHRRRIEELPIAASVIEAIDFFDRRRDAERYKLLREVAHCPTMEAVYEALLRRLCEIFGWSNASAYRVDHARGRIRLVSTCKPPAPPVVAGLDYEQGIDEGILGRVVRTGLPQVVGDVTKDPDYMPGAAEGMNSELCWPIGVEDAKVRWIIDVEDERWNAFSEEERRWLGETTREVAGFLQRLSTLNFLSECLDCTSEPMVVVDANHVVKRANPAAAELFGVATAKDVKGDLASMFDAEGDMRSILRLPDGYLGEFAVRRQDGNRSLQVDISRKPLPEDIGGAIYVFKDLRPIRRALELELMERTAYEIALETRTPLMYAVSALERVVRDETPMPPATADRVLKYLYRTKHAYTKLAMFNPSVRSSPGPTRSIDLWAEVLAIYRSLPDEMRALVQIECGNNTARIAGDCFQIAFVLETVLMFFIRTAPEELPVAVSVQSNDGFTGISIEGFLPHDWPMAGDVDRNEAMQSELRLAYPLIMELLRKNQGRYNQERLAGDRVRYSVKFPETQ